MDYCNCFSDHSPFRINFFSKVVVALLNAKQVTLLTVFGTCVCGTCGVCSSLKCACKEFLT